MENLRCQGDQKKCYKDTLKASLKDFNIPPESWEQTAHDRAKWRSLIRKEEDTYEAMRVCKAEQTHSHRCRHLQN